MLRKKLLTGLTGLVTLFVSTLCGQVFTVSGTVYDAVDSTGLEGAAVYFLPAGENDDLRTFSDEQGHFSFMLSAGQYTISAYKYDYLASPSRVYHILSDTSGIEFALTAPAFSINKDSILVPCSFPVSFKDTLIIENTGSGDLYFSVAAAKDEEELPVLSKRGESFMPPFAARVTGTIQLKKDNGMSSAMVPMDSLWQLVYQDPADNSQGILDINQIWMQVSGGELYCRTTFHHSVGSNFANFEYYIFIDTDGDRNTGDGGGWGWIGMDYLFMVSDFGYGPGAILCRWINQSWQYIRQASYVNMRTSSFIFAFPLSSLGNVNMLSFLSEGRSLSSNLDVDAAPDMYTGLFLFSTSPDDRLTVAPYFATISPGGTDTVIIAIDPGYFSGEGEQSYLLFACNAPENPFTLIPVMEMPLMKEVISGDQKGLKLDQNHPNPFNPTTTIRYINPVQGVVTLKVFDLLGREVATLVDKQQDAGEYLVKFDGSRLAAGIYFYQLRSNHFQQTRKFILVK